MKVFRHKLYAIIFRSRWALRRIGRPADWTILGISKQVGSMELYAIIFGILGFEMQIWIKKQPRKKEFVKREKL